MLCMFTFLNVVTGHKGSELQEKEVETGTGWALFSSGVRASATVPVVPHFPPLGKVFLQIACFVVDPSWWIVSVNESTLSVRYPLDCPPAQCLTQCLACVGAVLIGCSGLRGRKSRRLVIMVDSLKKVLASCTVSTLLMVCVCDACVHFLGHTVLRIGWQPSAAFVLHRGQVNVHVSGGQTQFSILGISLHKLYTQRHIKKS